MVAVIGPQQDHRVVELPVGFHRVEHAAEHRVGEGDAGEVALQRGLPDPGVEHLLLELVEHERTHEFGNVGQVAVERERQHDIVDRIEVEVLLRHHPVEVRPDEAEEHRERIVAGGVEPGDRLLAREPVGLLLERQRRGPVVDRMVAAGLLGARAIAEIGHRGLDLEGHLGVVEHLADQAGGEPGAVQQARQRERRGDVVAPQLVVVVHPGDAGIEPAQRRGARGVAHRHLREGVLERGPHRHDAVDVGSEELAAVEPLRKANALRSSKVIERKFGIWETYACHPPASSGVYRGAVHFGQLLRPVVAKRAAWRARE